MFFAEIANHITNLAALVGQRALAITIAPASEFSIFSLLCSLMIAAGFLIMRRPHNRPIRPRVLLRALLPRRWFKHASSHADIGMMALNVFVSGSLVGWAILSSITVEHFVSGQMNTAFGATGLIAAPAWVGNVAMTMAVYVAYEFAYFTDHYLSHHIPVLWQFHRTHHTAETLSPVTNYRVHPVDSIVFYNIVGLFIGFASAAIRQIFGNDISQFGFGGSNLILLVALYMLTHLHHSHMWIAFTGKLGRVVLSPAHHQLHHSTDPRHFNRNFGNTLALFDWMAGTLHIPTKKRQVLTFGAGPLPYDPHSVTGTLIMPFVDAFNLGRRPAGQGEPVTSHRLSHDSAPATTSSAA